MPGGATTVYQARARSFAGVDDEAVSVRVPAGSYLVTVSANLENEGPALSTDVTCTMTSSEPGVGIAGDGVIWRVVQHLGPRIDGAASTGWIDSIAATAGMAVGAPVDIRFVCESSAYPSASPVAVEALLTASSVGSVVEADVEQPDPLVPSPEAATAPAQQE
jgi:hypothetical protein